MTRIAVVIPVGPEAHHARYLAETIDSVAGQTRLPDLLVLVDDMHGLIEQFEQIADVDTAVYTPPWRLGVGHAFNHGCAVAFSTRRLNGLAQPCDLALMLGADDMLETRALEHLATAYEQRREEGLYWFDVIYSDGEEQRLPCNAAAFTRGWFRESGGLPIEASAGGMDAALISAMLVHRPKLLHHVAGPDGRYWVRRHAEQEGARLNAYAAAMIPIRDTFTRIWQPTHWGRYE